MITRRKFIGASAALAAVAALPPSRVQSLQVGHQPWAGMPEEEQAKFRTWLGGYGVEDRLTYRVDIHSSHMVVYQFHGPSPHLACRGGVVDDVCRVQPFEVAL